jgi:[glutamine synthetase] adenylyltransferase / [glutamine synthetase]-adenylyl-L-tyrosine phosphorylase
MVTTHADGSDRFRSRRESLERASRTLSEFLARDDRLRALLAEEGPIPDRAGYEMHLQEAFKDGFSALRMEKRRRLAEIAARDLAGELSVDLATAALADLADAVIEVTLRAVDAPAGLTIIAMGKLGGRELNYCSDIDVMFVTDEALDEATRAAERFMGELTAFAPEGQIYRVDADLRPEGKAGALVRTLDGYAEYYRRWAHAWEHQALIKARWVAGSSEIGEAFIAEAHGLVWPQEVSTERITSIRKMKERVESHAVRVARRKRTQDERDVKLGPGGIRDIEFSIQLLQLVHGVADPSVRCAGSMDALEALTDDGYVAEDDSAGLGVAYRWLRAVEHRVQLWQERQTHHLPDEPEAIARIAKTLGFRDTPSHSATERFESRHRAVLTDVRGRFEKLFYRPMIESLADRPGPGLSEEALKERLRVLAFRDVDRSARTLAGLVGGSSRRAKLFRVLTPALLRFLASTPLPDEGLFGFLRLGESLENRVDLLGALRDNPPGLAFLATVLGSGRVTSDLLEHVPEEVTTIATAQVGPPKDRTALVKEATSSLGWRDPERKLDGLRRFKRRAMLRVALADLAGDIPDQDVGKGLTDVAEACLEAALEDVNFPFAVIAMGKLGGRELAYSSDIDVMFVHEGDPHEAERVAERLMRDIGSVTAEGQVFRMDANLRPEGKAGALARSYEAYVEYYDRWGRPWERLALIKSRVAAGDRSLGDRLVAHLREVTYGRPVAVDDLAEVRHLKARMERERIPRGTQPRRHFKLGPGGISDIEFAVQLLQFRHGAGRPLLQETETLAAIDGAVRSGLLDADAARRLDEAYRFLARLRNRLFLMHGKAADALPSRPEDVEALGRAMGLAGSPRQELEERYLRSTRRARAIAEPLIYGSA